MEHSIKNEQTKEIMPFVLLSIAVILSFTLWKINYKGAPNHPPTPKRDKMIGTQAPSFTLPDIKGVMHSLEDYRGKVVFLNIWATWCKPCADEMPSMEKLYRRFKDKGLEVLAASIDYDKSLVEPFMNKYGLTFTALLDSEGKTSKSYKTTGVPETFIINKKGLVVEKVVGPLDWEEEGVFNFFEKLLAPEA